jgi:hypothetical protein
VRGSSAPNRTLAPAARPHRLDHLGREELGDRRAHLTFLVEHEVREPLPAPLLRQLLERGELGARELLRHGQVLHARSLREHLELRVARLLGEVVQLEPEAQVGLVGAVARHRLVPGQAPERPLRRRAAERLERRADRAFERLPDVFPRRERELEVELAELELAVRAEILVPEAGRHLVVAAHPATIRICLKI